MKQDLAKIIVLGQYGVNKLQSAKNVLLSRTEVLGIELSPILKYVHSNLDQIPLRQLAIILQGVALVYMAQRQTLEKGVKGLLSDLNGDNLWNSVLKHKKAQLARDRREGGAPKEKQVRFKLNQQQQADGGAPPQQIMDLRRLLDFTKDRLHFLESHRNSGANPEEADHLREGNDHSGAGFHLGGLDQNASLQMDQALEEQMRYSQGHNEGADFKQLLDDNFEEMLKGGVFLGQEGNQNCIEFLQPQRRDSQMSFNSFNLLSGSFSFGHPSQQGDDDREANPRRKENNSLRAFLADQDTQIQMQDGAASNNIRAARSLAGLKTKGTATQRKQELFFDFMADLFQPDTASNKFLSRAAIHAADVNNQGSLQALDAAGGNHLSAFKEKNLMESIMQSSSNGKQDWTGEQLRSGADFSSHKFSAQQLVNLHDEEEKASAIGPMKLNFSNEALGESGIVDPGDNIDLMGHDAGQSALLQEFPSLRDLETSNLLTNRFMGDKAAKFALQAIDQEKRDQMTTLERVLQKESSLSFKEFISHQPEVVASTAAARRKQATSCFAGLLAFSQIGACELIQTSTSQTFQDITIIRGGNNAR